MMSEEERRGASGPEEVLSGSRGYGDQRRLAGVVLTFCWRGATDLIGARREEDDMVVFLC